MGPTCSICGSQTRLQHRDQVLGKYEVAYFYCDRCGLLQTEEPYWLKEAYADAIADSDTGLVTRNIALAVRLSSVLYSFFDPRARYVDVGGGYGVLTRLMRDVGFDFFWSDPYCDNLFARGFEAEPEAGPYEAITAFEVMEHLRDPLGFIRQHLAEYGSSTFIFSTELYQGMPPPPGSWAYYAPGTGQHISFYQRRTLQVMADRLSLSCYSRGYFHVLTERRLNPLLYKVAASKASVSLLPLLRLKLGSRTLSDRELVLQRGARITGPSVDR
ncbi:MAG: class I SAM-dependent methyltransferase [Longimicrobiaceae bacterium]